MFAKIKPLHPNFKLPTRGEGSAGFDLYMPEPGEATGTTKMVGLGFATEIPPGYVGLLLPRSGVGAKHGLEVNNTCGVIDSDYRGEWKAAIRTKSGIPHTWAAGDRLLQAIIVPYWAGQFEIVDELPETIRGDGGFGHSGK